jgi:hypothetical protein
VGYLKFNDVPDVSLQPLLDNIEELRKLPPAGQQKRATELLGGKPPMVQRLFVGSGLEKESGVKLMDAAGKPRLELKVTADGRASIEFLDGDGKVVRRLSPDEVCAQ